MAEADETKNCRDWQRQYRLDRAGREFAGAGDAFNGGLAVAWAEGLPLEAAVRFANAVGALAATRLGAQTSLPTAADVAAFLSQAGVN